MPTVRRTKLWTAKPPMAVRFNLSHPQAQGLVDFWPVLTSLGPLDNILRPSMKGTFNTNQATASFGDDGPAYLSSGSSNQNATIASWDWANSIGLNTVGIRFQPAATSASIRAIFRINFGGFFFGLYQWSTNIIQALGFDGGNGVENNGCC